MQLQTCSMWIFYLSPSFIYQCNLLVHGCYLFIVKMCDNKMSAKLIFCTFNVEMFHFYSIFSASQSA